MSSEQSPITLKQYTALMSRPRVFIHTNVLYKRDPATNTQQTQDVESMVV